MTATLQQMLDEPKTLLELARSGEEVVLTDDGKPVVRMTGVPASKPKPSQEALNAWIDEVARHAKAASTGKANGPTPDEIVAKLRADKTVPTEAEMEKRRKWLERVAARAIEASIGKKDGPTTEQIIDDLREERG